jgi:hypothetical protein
LSVVSVGRIDVPLHDVRILVLCGLTKQPMDAPCILEYECLHKTLLHIFIGASSRGLFLHRFV